MKTTDQAILYSHFKLYWKTFSAETRVIARNTCLNLNLNDYSLLSRCLWCNRGKLLTFIKMKLVDKKEAHIF